ncbi:MAG: hypothetical protein DSM107014_16715 [Gomphosphaeria aponina SAG 52.96 = DSM 107014]|uniref:Uncharacterized protein n=1 Tax=Gomphosphaeria aponina SAG 52.96 = DSM 107014 TaxID=1521640 RepID=A0A941JT41_9CHRO|nr:hypothetical protein [Gomphosphaeria aponina SAG 52.96 = DSM 107014]
MLTQFRKHYPQGSLISELVTIDHGKYIVRTLVQIEGVTLASGLAAAETVEQAEDQARNRALAILDLDSATQSIILPDLQPVVNTKVEEKSFPPAPPPPPASFQAPTPEVVTSSDNYAYSFDEEFSPDSQTTLPHTITPAPSFSETEIVAPENPVETTTQPQPNGGAPIDFSEIIAKTDIELKRLGWTKEKGRDYLLQTYGKKSRHYLSDDELLEFLNFLTSQPNP